MFKQEAMDHFLNPKSIAIVGVSKNFSSISGKPLSNLTLHEYKGDIYPVNPKYDEIKGLTCYASLLDIPGEVDVALIAVSHKRIMQILDECEQKKIKYLVLFGSGFAEVGKEGKQLQERVLKKAKNAGIHILGPNCVGLLNVKESIPIGFATSFETKEGFKKGNVGFASQSGAFGFSLFGLAQEENIGFSYIVNTGNQMDIHTLDCMEYMLEDDETDVVAGYLESIPDGEMLIRIAKRSKELGKPLIILKAGRSHLGKKAALSHTASLAGSEKTFEAIAKQYGLVTVNDIDDMVAAMKIFSRNKKANGNKVVTISNSGAAGIAMADYSEPLGLELVRLSPDTQSTIERIIPPYGSALNPIDITAQALKEQHIFTETLEVLIKDDNVDTIVVQTTFGGELGKDICNKIANIDKKTEKPIIVTLTGTNELTGEGRDILSEAGVPVFLTSYNTMLAIKYLVDYSNYYYKSNQEFSENKQVNDELVHNKGVWTEDKVKEMLDSMQISVPKNILVKNRTDLVNIEGELEFPVVCKVVSNEITHKTDVGGVKLGIKNSAELKVAYDEIINSVNKHAPGANINGVLIEEMIKKNGTEMFIGVKEDPQFGPLIVCGLGGIFIEVLKDASIRRAPIQVDEAYEMLKELKGFPLLEGVRGEKEKDVEKLTEVIVKISQFASQNRGKIKEMDINPLMVLEKGEGVIALDGVIVWKESTTSTVTSV
ncbi:acetate--CoA ligase family protein [Oceanobacillus senegalensis]|uniref:acetate--CoA ligase family protein n=1 Tax=Oceanobacillus senegalensis TaxID=1936063 RepID=UPI000A305079|nr:acetate--CoA ligase family protein [Oceanobacillus senegalensis]